MGMWSPSTRGCGLKLIYGLPLTQPEQVTLHARVWIETFRLADTTEAKTVTLHARVWIETTLPLILKGSLSGHPPREGVD